MIVEPMAQAITRSGEWTITAGPAGVQMRIKARILGQIAPIVAGLVSSARRGLECTGLGWDPTPDGTAVRVFLFARRASMSTRIQVLLICFYFVKRLILILLLLIVR